MRSTQFNDRLPLEEDSEEYRGRHHPDTLCETIKGLGYTQNKQVMLYGELFDLVSDPVIVGEKLVFVAALDREGQMKRVRIPANIVQMARIKARAA